MRTSTFENLGENISILSENGIPAKMDFEVSLRPMGYLDDNGAFNRVEGNSTVVDEFGRAYGAVSDNYQPINNAEALGFVSDIDNLELKKFGSLNNGMQFLIGQLPTLDILGDDYTPYLCFRNSFNGRYPIQMAICPLRIVCQNQLNLAFRNAENAFNIRHTVNAKGRLEEAQRIMMGTATYLDELKRRAEKFANTKVTEAEVATIMDELFPIKDNMTDRQKNTINAKRTAFTLARYTDDTANFRGTFWGLLNAYTDFITHEEPVRQTKTQAENHFTAVTFDPRIMARFMQISRSVVGANLAA